MQTTWVILLTALIMFGVGAFTLIKVILQLRRIAASKEWPVIPGQVIKKEVVRHRSSKGAVTYSADVTYRYSVMGSEYNHRVSLPGMWSSTTAQQALEGIGATLEVHYNPDKPSQSSNEYDRVSVRDYMVIATTLLLGVMLVIFQIR
jgi:hypothetical protein